MPRSNTNRAKGKHKGGRKQYTGNKFLITSAEALLIQRQIAELTDYVRTLYLGTHMRLTALEPQKEAAPEVGAQAEIVPELAFKSPQEPSNDAG